MVSIPQDPPRRITLPAFRHKAAASTVTLGRDSKSFQSHRWAFSFSKSPDHWGASFRQRSHPPDPLTPPLASALHTLPTLYGVQRHSLNERRLKAFGSRSIAVNRVGLENGLTCSLSSRAIDPRASFFCWVVVGCPPRYSSAPSSRGIRCALLHSCRVTQFLSEKSSDQTWPLRPLAISVA